MTFADDTSTTSPGSGGPFAKESDGTNVGQAYLGYKGFPDIILTAGKMPNPLVTTFMLWDPDINPEGISEQWKHTFTFGSDAESETASYTKYGTALPMKQQKSGGSKFKIDIFANFAQFVYDDANPENPIGPSPRRIPNTDAFLLATLLTHFRGDLTSQNQTGVNSLLVFDIPAEIGWKLGELPMRLFADFAVNLNGDDRAALARSSASSRNCYFAVICL